MMKNQLAGLMKQAQQMQDNMKKAQEELAQTEVEGQSGAGMVKVVMTCRHDVKRVTIDPSLLARGQGHAGGSARGRDQRRRAPRRGDDPGEDVRPHDGHADAAGLQAAVLRRVNGAAVSASTPAMNQVDDAASGARASAIAAEAPSGMDALARALRSLPGVGPKAAQRMALHLLQHDRDGACASRTRCSTPPPPSATASDAIRSPKTRSARCAARRKRDPSLLCVVETPADLLMVEQTQAYSGLYYVLMGRLSPLDGIGPKEIRLDRLIKRATDGVVKEAVLATNFTNEGEATAHYIGEMLTARGLKVSRLARGVPVGGELEYVDSGTLAQAMRDRRTLGS